MPEASEPVLTTKAEIHADLPRVRQWFLQLSEHPKRYAFESHGGFTFTDGAFGEPGARFETKERFLCIRQTLKFLLTEVGDTFFRFELRKPIDGIWGRFVLDACSPAVTELRLEVGANSRVKRVFLTLPVISYAVRSQIQDEVSHIKSSVEHLVSQDALRG